MELSHFPPGQNVSLMSFCYEATSFSKWYVDLICLERLPTLRFCSCWVQVFCKVKVFCKVASKVNIQCVKFLSCAHLGTSNQKLNPAEKSQISAETMMSDVGILSVSVNISGAHGLSSLLESPPLEESKGTRWACNHMFSCMSSWCISKPWAWGKV